MHTNGRKELDHDKEVGVTAGPGGPELNFDKRQESM